MGMGRPSFILGWVGEEFLRMGVEGFGVGWWVTGRVFGVGEWGLGWGFWR
jgi:hypothetical protein